MALISSNATKRIFPPHEPETYFDVRPIRAGDFEGLDTDGQQVTLSIDLLTSLITAWSYDEPVTRENVASLDLDTFLWLQGELKEFSGIRGDAEKKGSGPEPQPVAVPSLASSLT